MFDKLDDLLIRFEEVLNELGEPDVTSNPDRFQKLMKEQSDLQPIVDTYKEYKKNKETIQDSLSMLEEEKDEEMREMLKEELSDAKKRVEELEHDLKILLLPKDPNDNKNVIVEIRGGAGGDADGDRRRADRAGSGHHAARPQRAGQTCRAEARRPGGLCARDGAGGAVGLSLCDGPDTAAR